MRILPIFFLFIICLGCKKEDKTSPIQELQPTQQVNLEKKRVVRYPDTTRYDSIKNNFSLTSLNFNENRIDFKLPNYLEDFEIQFSNTANDRLKIKYIKKENAFYINQEKATYKRLKSGLLTDFNIILDPRSISFSVNGNTLYKRKDISLTKPYTVMTFLSKKQTMTHVVVSKNKRS